jgi:hypothetical protein
LPHPSAKTRPISFGSAELAFKAAIGWSIYAKRMLALARLRDGASRSACNSTKGNGLSGEERTDQGQEGAQAYKLLGPTHPGEPRSCNARREI